MHRVKSQISHFLKDSSNHMCDHNGKQIHICRVKYENNPMKTMMLSFTQARGKKEKANKEKIMMLPWCSLQDQWQQSNSLVKN